MSRAIVVTVCGDPGGASALAPVIKLLAAEGKVDLLVYAYNEATDIFTAHGIEARPLPQDVDPQWAVRRLQQDRPDVLVTGTSQNGVDWEKIFVAAARAIGINTLAVLDFWSNYRARFTGAAGELDCLPDAIAVMDERARSEMVAAGIPTETIIVTGQPAFDALADTKARCSPEQSNAVRAALKVGVDDLLVLFASQPLSHLYGAHSPASPSRLGYDQHGVLRLLIDALEAASEKTTRPVTLLVRPHPREDRDDYQAYQSSRIKVLVSAEGDGRRRAMAADLVAGMNTALLVEACYLGCVVVSIQPGLRGTDVLPTNQWGASAAIYREEDARPVLERMLLDEPARRAALTRASALQLDASAARRIADHVYACTSKCGFNEDKRASSRA